MRPPNHNKHCDTILGDEHHGWYCYGPRVLRGDVDVETPKPGEAPHFWGIYRWLSDEMEWRWMIDVSRKEDARKITLNLIVNPDYQPEPEQIAA